MKILNKKFILIIPILLIILFSFHLNSVQLKMNLVTIDTNVNLPLYLLGTVRIVIADMLWLRADLYHHSYEWRGEYWGDNENLVMLYRLITYLNPQQDKAYAQGGYHLSMNLRKPKDGMEFLQEGLKYNPNSEDIHFELGYEYFFIYNQYDKAIYHLRRTATLTDDPLEKQVCYKLIAHSYYKQDNYRDSLIYWLKVKELAPHQPMVNTWIKQLDNLIREE